MGVSGFYSYLFKKYPNIKSVCTEKNLADETKCHSLYLDLNHIIHKYAESNDKNHIIKDVIEHIDRLVRSIKPSQLLYIAMDGVAPKARMPHQRTKRFLKSKNIPDREVNRFETNEQHKLEKKTFDECNIKPGTEFMCQLSKCLRYFIRNRMHTEEDWRSVNVILSDANVPGEGEHKIINFIRQQRHQQNNTNGTFHVVYSSDSDLVLLGLLTHEPQMKVLCEVCANCEKIGYHAKDCNTNKSSSTPGSNTKTNYAVIHLPKLINNLKSQNYDSPVFLKNLERFVDDWVLICLLFGNDFLPKSHSIDFFDKSIITMDHLMDAYREALTKNNDYLTKNGTITKDCLLTLMKKVGGKDKDGKYRRPLYYEDKFRRPLYYKDKFGFNATDLNTFSNKVATDYVQGLYWVFQYYSKGPPSWTWYYPHHYAPLAYDFSNVKNLDLKFDPPGEPVRPFEQMMATFSPKNVDYLPLAWRPIMTEEIFDISKFYPTEFVVDPNGKERSSQYVVLIPFIDKETLSTALKDFTSKLTPEEEKRNRLDYDSLFIHSSHSIHQQFRKSSDANKIPIITEENPVQLQDISDCKLVGHGWTDDTGDISDLNADEEAILSDYKNIPNDEIILLKYCHCSFRSESTESEKHNNVRFRTTTNQPSQTSTVQRQQQAPKSTDWGRSSSTHQN
ncbi:unnamed protein product [Adineta steineri]|uniref:Uncharacterized protein n=1 Tax=Adineta steineri TaxID=433720 RepID=A0A815AMQ0_9BILA|nr:unnamed protein product [Adineta steineri]CAF1259121.1 unnamed protein product [Adineta steineri]CAF1521170.1 unnamed protein product [Adineta steineri]CAF1547259.1 unnamed protein product [Adineta steineri]